MDPQIQQIIDMLKGLGLSGWGMIIAVMVIVFLQWKAGNLPFLDPILGRFFAPKEDVVIEGEVRVDPYDRESAFSAVDYLIGYFEEEGCTEGEAAARALGPHLFHQHKSDVHTA